MTPSAPPSSSNRLAAMATRCQPSPHVRPPATARPPAVRPCKEHR